MFSEDNDYLIRGPEPHEPLPHQTLGQIFWRVLKENAAGHQIMIDAHTGKDLLSEQLLEQSCHLAQALLSYGCTPETTVAIASENNLEFFVPVMASIFAGTIMVPLSVNYTPSELQHTVHITKPKIVFCSKRASPGYLQMKKEMSFIEVLVVIDSDESISGTKSISTFIQDCLGSQRLSPTQFSPFDGDPKENVAFVLCSSGTTGMPKGVMLTHTNVVTRLMQSRDPAYLTPYTRVLGLMPFYHSYGLFFGLTSFLNRHITIMMDRYQEDFFLRAIQDYRIEVLRVTPPLAIFLSKSPKISDYDLSSVSEFFSAAAPLSGETEVELKKRLKLKMIYQAYGCTEGTLALTIMNKDVYRPGSCGQVVTYMTCKVRDPDSGRSLGPNQVGELCYKGPSVMKGYYGNPRATKESFTADGWLRTGDLGYYDEEKYFYIVDRLKELIKYKGHQVAPAELEAVLVNNPKVQDAAVVGLSDEMAGELPLAFIVKRDWVEVTAKELQDYVAERVSPPKRLRGGVIFVESIPKNPSGKILRRKLKSKLKSYTALQQSKL